MRCSQMEQMAVENWHGQGVPTTQSNKRPRKSYLEPSSEIIQTDFTRLRKIAPIGLLKNGHLVNLKPIRITKDLSLTLSNTCGFDSIIQLMAAAFCDSETFQQLIQLNREYSETASVIYNIVKEGVTKKTYKMRALLLQKIFNTEEHPCGIINLQCETEISNLLPKLDCMPCIFNRIQCTCCSYSETKLDNFIEVIITNEISIENAIKQKLGRHQYKKKCVHLTCSGQVYKTTEVGLTHLFVVPLNSTTKNFEVNSSLKDIPARIVIGNNIYILRGLIGYIGPQIGLGHFIAYCFRHNWKWEQYDDREAGSQPCSSKKMVRVQLLLYSL